MIRKALHEEEERKRIGRENFPMTTVPIAVHAAYEPSLHHGDLEHEEGIYSFIYLFYTNFYSFFLFIFKRLYHIF